MIGGDESCLLAGRTTVIDDDVEIANSKALDTDSVEMAFGTVTVYIIEFKVLESAVVSTAELS